MTLKSPKKLKFIPAKIVAEFTTNAQVNAYFTDHEKMENQFPQDGKV